MKRVKITCDSTADLSAELIEKYDISVIPLYIVLGESSGRDGMEITRTEVFEFVGLTGVLPKTSAVSRADYLERFSEYADAGLSVVHISIGSGFSVCNQNAASAAKELGGKVHVVDSRNLSTGTGLLALLGAELAEKGLPADQIAQRLGEAAERVEASFVIDTLEYLYKGGRCSALAQLGANLLGLRPCIEVKNGRMGVGRKYRGKIARCLEMYVDERLYGRSDIDTARIFITHTFSDEELVRDVAERVRAAQPFKEVLITDAGCTIASHCGPGTLGVLFLRSK